MPAKVNEQSVGVREVLEAHDLCVSVWRNAALGTRSSQAEILRKITAPQPPTIRRALPRRTTLERRLGRFHQLEKLSGFAISPSKRQVPNQFRQSIAKPCARQPESSILTTQACFSPGTSPQRPPSRACHPSPATATLAQMMRTKSVRTPSRLYFRKHLAGARNISGNLQRTGRPRLPGGGGARKKGRGKVSFQSA